MIQLDRLRKIRPKLGQNIWASTEMSRKSYRLRQLTRYVLDSFCVQWRWYEPNAGTLSRDVRLHIQGEDSAESCHSV
jgi:hypothetical protein